MECIGSNDLGAVFGPLLSGGEHDIDLIGYRVGFDWGGWRCTWSVQ